MKWIFSLPILAVLSATAWTSSLNAMITLEAAKVSPQAVETPCSGEASDREGCGQQATAAAPSQAQPAAQSQDAAPKKSGWASAFLSGFMMSGAITLLVYFFSPAGFGMGWFLGIFVGGGLFLSLMLGYF